MATNKTPWWQAYEENRYLIKLPDAYCKQNGSNTEKLLRIPREQHDGAARDLYGMEIMLDIAKATGATLELYGDMLGQRRGNLNDEAYRMLILKQVALNYVDGSYQSVTESARYIFGAGKEELEIKDSEEPAVVKITKLPYDVISAAGMTPRQAVSVITALVGAGIRVEAENFEGTFEFTGIPSKNLLPIEIAGTWDAEIVTGKLPDDIEERIKIKGLTVDYNKNGEIYLYGTIPSNSDNVDILICGLEPTGGFMRLMHLAPGKYHLKGLPKDTAANVGTIVFGLEQGQEYHFTNTEEGILEVAEEDAFGVMIYI